MTDEPDVDRRVVGGLLVQTLDGEPRLDLDLGEVRAAGRRVRRRRMARSVALATAAAATLSVVALALDPGVIRTAEPAGPGPSVTVLDADRRADQEAAAREARQQAAGNVWRASAVAAVVGALGHEATLAPVNGRPALEELIAPDGSHLGYRGLAQVDVLRVADDRLVRDDLSIEVRTGDVESGGQCEALPELGCSQERLPDGSVLRRGEAPDDENGLTVRVVQVVSDTVFVEVTAPDALTKDGTVSPALSLDQLQKVATSPSLAELPSF